MADNKAKILIVDDNPDILEVLRLTLENEGFIVEEAENGKIAVEKVYTSPPDLLILDYMMPEMNGYEVCKTLKKDILYRHIPIIMLTARGEIIDKVKGIEAGADDYVVKPFEPVELLARVRMILRRTVTSLDANPLTKLPGNISIKNELNKRLQKDEHLAVCHIDLSRFKAFNDKYGFEHGDKVIKFTGDIIIDVVKKIGNPNDFIGHIGGDDFVVVTSPKLADAICTEIIKIFDENIGSYYSEDDRKKGYIISRDRRGNINKFPLMTMYIAVVTNENRKIEYPEQISEIGAELGNYAKSFQKSIYIKDRRVEPK